MIYVLLDAAVSEGKENLKLEMFCFQKQPTEHFTDLGKLNFRWWFGFRLKPIFSTAPAASKNNAQFKRGQNQLDYTKQLASLI